MYIYGEYYWVYWKDVNKNIRVDSILWDETQEFYCPNMDYFGYGEIIKVVHNPRPKEEE